jgi:hypothetical protein
MEGTNFVRLQLDSRGGLRTVIKPQVPKRHTEQNGAHRLMLLSLG